MIAIVATERAMTRATILTKKRWEVTVLKINKVERALIKRQATMEARKAKPNILWCKKRFDAIIKTTVIKAKT